MALMKFFVLWIFVVDLTGCFYNPAYSLWRSKQLLNTELASLKTVEKQLTNKERLLNTAERRFSRMVSLKGARASREVCLNSPLPALTLVRSLAEDWASLAALVGGIPGHTTGLLELGLGKVRWPNNQAVSTAGFTVFRSQHTYDLNTKMLAEGVLNGNSLTNISAADCLLLASINRNYLFFTEAVEWLQEALNKISLGDNSVRREQVLHLLAPALCYKGDEKGVRLVFLELIRKYPNTEIPTYLMEDYDQITKFRCKELSMNVKVTKQFRVYEYMDEVEFIKHKKLCQGKWKIESNLRCRYVHHQQHHLRFQPFKLEELKRDPPVLRFYDAITDSEMEELKLSSVPAMRIAGTRGRGSQNIYTNIRTSHNAWLATWGTKPRNSLTSRIADMTRLNVWYGEPNQLSRYSLAGEYLSHRDFLANSGKPFQWDRIATLMFYLNDVKQGGNTVFLHWNVFVPPIKKSAVLWFNYKRNGELEMDSEHSGCPVLEGSKWVLNRWFYNGGQEFIMPCGVNINASFNEFYLV